MTSIFNEKTIFVKQLARVFKFGHVFEFYNQHKVKIGEAREEEITGWKKFVKMTKYSALLPFTISIYDSAGNKIVTLRKPFKWWMQEVNIHDEKDNVIGRYKQKFTFFKPTFHIFDNEREFAMIQGNFVGWSYNITSASGQPLGVINKKFSGLAKEMFTTADNYQVKFEDSSLTADQKKILTSISCVIDMIFKNRKN